MKTPGEVLNGILSSRKGDVPSSARRRSRTAVLSCAPLEGRVTPSGFGFAHHVSTVFGGHAGVHHSHATSTTTTSAANTALQTAITAIESKSGTTVGELTAIRTTFQALAADGLSATRSALATFENSLVTANASGTTLATDTTLPTQFAALYTSTPTAQQTSDLTAAYSALAAAVTSSNITTADIAAVNSAYSAVVGATSTATFPYFSLVTGQAGGGFGGGCH